MSAQPNFDLTGRTAVVTGGAGMLGKQFIETLAAAGAQVASFDLKELDITSLSKEVQDRVFSYTLDTTNEDAVAKAFKELAQHGTATIVVHAAGIDTRPDAPASDNGSFENYSAESWDTVIDSHLRSAFLVSREFFRELERTRTKGGSIITISSMYGVVTPDQTMYQYRRDEGETFFKPVTYTTAKAGMIGFTKWLAEYGAAYGVRANTLVLGGVYAGQDPRFVAEYERRTPLKRMAQPDEYNGALLFLASDASSYATGAEFTIDGGWTAR